ncbi:MAG: hypothetical protein SPL40_02665 [Erysipelotrichaceae bacterium]|nr:hypothetical protein [Erysipelotrichaceae bacterium]
MRQKNAENKNNRNIVSTVLTGAALGFGMSLLVIVLLRSRSYQIFNASLILFLLISFFFSWLLNILYSQRKPLLYAGITMCIVSTLVEALYAFTTARSQATLFSMGIAFLLMTIAAMAGAIINALRHGKGDSQ